MNLGGVTIDGTTVFALAAVFVALAVVAGVVGFALWYSGDQQEL